MAVAAVPIFRFTEEGEGALQTKSEPVPFAGTQACQVGFFLAWWRADINDALWSCHFHV